MSGSEEKKINKLKLRKMLYTKLKVATPEFNANISLLALYFPPKKKISIKFDFAQKELTTMNNGKVERYIEWNCVVKFDCE